MHPTHPSTDDTHRTDPSLVTTALAASLPLAVMAAAAYPVAAASALAGVLATAVYYRLTAEA
ncbi:hypothetical protein RYH80_10610 [Halobaculum sp. MBLA0147]|uniref:hypothetical protein n=1 Tax=Halobaculum sp. MBLA0147 TaxID=3079934 RepID=UPI003525C38B